MILELNKQNFKSAINNNDKIVAVYFWEPRCEQCKTLELGIEELANEYKDKGVVFGKINIEEDSDVMDDFWIGSVPALICFKDGKLVDAIVGEITKQDCAMILDSVLSKHK